MNPTRLKAIINAVREQCGMQAAATVAAALEIAWSDWTPEHEAKFGSWVAQYLLSDKEEL